VNGKRATALSKTNGVAHWPAMNNLDAEERSRVMGTGVKLNLTKTIRSPKTGRLLPKEGTLVSVTENLGRTLLLVEFAGGQHEYLFESEVEFEGDNACQERDGGCAELHI
jgi:hypothetical protein